MANDPAVKKALADIESARKSGRLVLPPRRLQAGNILGGKTAAFKKAVSEQGKSHAAAPVATAPEESQSILRRAVEARKKK